MTEDSLEIIPEYQFTDSIQRHLQIKYPWKEGSEYNLTIPKDALRDIFDIPNDSINLLFATSTKDDYGNIDLNITFNNITNGPLLVQLVQGEAEKEKVFSGQTIKNDTLVEFNNIPEGDYYLRAIEDLNEDGRWNSGSFSLKKQPEKVFYFHLPISIKKGWDIEDKWDLTLLDRKRPEKPKKEKKN